MVNKRLVITTNKTEKELTDQEMTLINQEAASTDRTITEADLTEEATTNNKWIDSHTEKTSRAITVNQEMTITTTTTRPLRNSKSSTQMKSTTQRKKRRTRMRSN